MRKLFAAPGDEAEACELEGEMVSTTYLDGFIPAGATYNKCLRCGTCLRRCPVMKMEKEEAEAEISRLITGEDTRRVLNECTFCFSCNHFCPGGLKPYNLIMERMVERNRKNGTGLLPFAAYMAQGRNQPGYFHERYQKASDAEKAILRKWSELPGRAKDVLFIGCYYRNAPLGIEQSKVLQSLPKYGPRDICCGDIPYRFGNYQAFREIADKAFNRLSSLKVDRMVCYCPSCANYFGNIWPNCHGLRLPFEIISLFEWLWEQYQKGGLQISRKVTGDVVISDSCHSGELGDHFAEAVRGLYEAAGMRVVDLRNNRHEPLCCGFACYLRGTDSKSGVSEATQRKMEQILETGTDNVTFICHGCEAHLSQHLAEANVKSHLAVDDILKLFESDTGTAGRGAV